MTALFQPEDSWVGKFAHLNNNVPGVYASHVTGRIPEDIEDTLAQKGFTYHPRDGSAEE
ncbi:transcription elongation factor spt4 [Coemansia sp. RSA 2322]|nr:transcription elongation factor spt4 [Coemansia sp. RSA 2322]